MGTPGCPKTQDYSDIRMGNNMGIHSKSQVALVDSNRRIQSHSSVMSDIKDSDLDPDFHKILLNSAILNNPDYSLWSVHDLLIERSSEITFTIEDCIEKYVLFHGRLIPIMASETALINAFALSGQPPPPPPANAQGPQPPAGAQASASANSWQPPLPPPLDGSQPPQPPDWKGYKIPKKKFQRPAESDSSDSESEESDVDSDSEYESNDNVSTSTSRKRKRDTYAYEDSYAEDLAEAYAQSDEESCEAKDGRARFNPKSSGKKKRKLSSFTSDFVKQSLSTYNSDKSIKKSFAEADVRN